MFDIMEKKLKEKKKDEQLVKEIKNTVPKIHTALSTPTDFEATETRTELYHSKEELIKWLLSNPEQIKQNRAIFNAILEKYRSISNKISKLL